MVYKSHLFLKKLILGGFWETFDLLLASFSEAWALIFHTFSTPIFQCFLGGVFSGFFTKMDQKWIPKGRSNRSLFRPFRRMGSAWGLPGSFWCPLGRPFLKSSTIHVVCTILPARFMGSARLCLHVYRVLLCVASTFIGSVCVLPRRFPSPFYGF